MSRRGPAGPDVNFSGNEANPLFHNTGKGFEEIGTTLGASRLEDGRGYVLVDLDRDGTQDVVLHNFYRNPALALMNRSGAGKRWLRVGLRGTKSNRFGIGARVRAGGQAQEMVAGHGYLSGNAPVLHFGLGAAAETDVQVRWPSGRVDEWKGLGADRVWTLTEGEAKASSEELQRIEVPVAEPAAPAPDPDVRELLAGLRTLEGKPAPVEGPALVVLFSLDCHACVEELKRMGELEERAKKQGLRLVWVTKDADPLRVETEFRANLAPSMPCLPPRALPGAPVPCVWRVTPGRVEKYVGRFAVTAALEDGPGR
jgi:hypothetical protein